jgi:predicted TIM-barrel fold metal-dependent hydrolase
LTTSDQRGAASAAPRIVDAEAHYLDTPFLEVLRGRSVPPREEHLGEAVRMYSEPTAADVFQGRSIRLEQALSDLGDDRIAAMDAAGIDVQVLSLNVPGVEQFGPAEGAVVARERNDILADAVACHPDRFVALAALCPDPDAPEIAADELERCVTKLGFRGWKVNSHIRDGFLDDERYTPLLERAAALDVPIYLHPTLPHGAMIGPYTGYGYMLPGPALGFGAETALHSMRLIYSGIFDRCENLQVVLGHLGEGLYFWLYRLDFEFTKPWLQRSPLIKAERRPSEYLRENFYASTSGHFQSSAFAVTLAEAGADRLLFATDHPYESGEQAVEWIGEQGLDEGDLAKILHGNADRLFGLAR